MTYVFAGAACVAAAGAWIFMCAIDANADVCGMCAIGCILAAASFYAGAVLSLFLKIQKG